MGGEERGKRGKERRGTGSRREGTETPSPNDATVH